MLYTYVSARGVRVASHSLLLSLYQADGAFAQLQSSAAAWCGCFACTVVPHDHRLGGLVVQALAGSTHTELLDSEVPARVSAALSCRGLCAFCANVVTHLYHGGPKLEHINAWWRTSSDQHAVGLPSPLGCTQGPSLCKAMADHPVHTAGDVSLQTRCDHRDYLSY